MENDNNGKKYDRRNSQTQSISDYQDKTKGGTCMPKLNMGHMEISLDIVKTDICPDGICILML